MTAIAAYPDDAAEAREARGLRGWLLFLILLVFAMVMVGGATRLTESGLSITEWNLVTGTVPPLDDAGWQAEFDLYKESPQYRSKNRGMSLSAFKTIYWWEWAHRELGRFIGLAYIAGFFWFVGRRSVPMKTALILAGVGLLLGAQGVVGWVMVASGLEPGMTAVAPLKLTLHLTLAAFLFAALIALFVKLGGAIRETVPAGRRWAARLLVALAFVQVALGGIVAGHNAGLISSTWPLMDGQLVPEGLALLRPLWLNAFENLTAIQFNHRLGAYVLAAAILTYAFRMLRRGDGPSRSRAALMALLIIAQMGVGIAALIQAVPTALALAHQAIAMILLFVLVWNASVFRTR
jgi:cytochrome c oxidase assembly protein subunit 15